MYNFVDTTEAQGAAVLPSEALKINGVYIENEIPGYRTLQVKGREALSPEVTTFETGARDGSTQKNKRFPARIITVTYQLAAASNSAFRDAYKKLGRLLNVDDAELIFNDEQDKYYTGTPSAIGEVEPGKNIVIGEFEILCADPFKYSVTEYEVSPTLDDGLGFVCTYNGTYKSFPTLEATFYSEEETEDDETDETLTGNGDCGYVAFFNENSKIIQLGNPDEADVEGLPFSQTLINWSFKKSTSWGTAAKKKWSVNSGVVTSSAVTQTGSPGIGKSSSDEYYLTASSFGSGTKWHGPSISRSIPADKAGDVGAKNCAVTVKHKMCIGSGKDDVKQRGGFQVLLTDADSKIVAGFNIFKSASGKKAKLRFYINGKTMETISIDLSYNNKYFGTNYYKKRKLPGSSGSGSVVASELVKTCKTSTITKSGKTVTFNIGGIKKVYRNDDITDSVITKLTVTMTKYGTYTPLKYNGMYWIKFVKNNCDIWRDVPNKFSADDVVIADCKNGEIYLNDTRAPELGALGNDWEEFYLQPGVNQIGASYSDWVQDAYAPTFKMRYREVFL